MTNPQVVFNGKMTTAARIGLPDMDRAFRFGDSWFETMLFRGRAIRYWDTHCRRIGKAASVFGFDVPDISSVPEWALRLADLLPDADSYRVRLTLWRTEGRGYMPLSQKTHWLLEVFEMSSPDTAVRQLGISRRTHIYSGRGFSGKTGNSAPYVMASAEARAEGWPHILLLNEKGMIAETANANIFWKERDTWHTPPLSSGCTDGVMRRHVIRILEEQGLRVSETSAPPQVLTQASEIFITNALIGIKNIHLFGLKEYPVHAEKIYSRFIG